MKTYTCSGYRLHEIDSSSNTIHEVKDAAISFPVDYAYLIKEDGVIATSNGGIDVKAGEIVVKMYAIGDADCEIFRIGAEDKLYDFCIRYSEYRSEKKIVANTDTCCNKASN